MPSTWTSLKSYYRGLNKPFQKRPILGSSKLKEFTDDNFEFNESDCTQKKLENIMGKGDIAYYNFSFFHSVFKTCTAASTSDLYNKEFCENMIICTIKTTLKFITLYQTLPYFSDPKIKAFKNIVGEKEKMLVTNIFLFPTIFSTLLKHLSQRDPH